MAEVNHWNYLELVRNTFTILVLISLSVNITAQPAERNYTRLDYIEQWKDEAIKQMHAHGIPASITLAQGILESADGNSALAKYANNHFGIKCHGWDGASFIQDDDEANECFRKYDSAEESYNDHSLFLTGRSRYSDLFELELTDYKGWAKGLKKAGYATNPKYADLLIMIIEDNELYQYDELEYVDTKNIPEDIDIEIPDELEQVVRDILVHPNDIDYVIVKDGDTPYTIARELDIWVSQVYKYNELSGNDILRPGDIVYLQPKRNKAKEEYHTVLEGETMYSISQKYGIKLKKLYKKNLMEEGTQPAIGQVLYLRKNKKE